MSHISSELLNERNLSLWLATIAVLAFAAGYSLASIRHSVSPPQQTAGLHPEWNQMALGKYGHLSQKP